jgi:hypothetical protein
VGAGGEMTQALYAHMNNNNKKERKKENLCVELLSHNMVILFSTF